MTSTTFIYVLKDPTDLKVRYVGKTNNPYQRFRNHTNKARRDRCHKYNWIMSLKNKGMKPIMEIIKEVPISEWKYWEKHYIKYYKNLGCDLTNYCDGGEGLNFGNQTSFKKGNISPTAGTGMKKKCVVCGEEFRVSPSRYNVHKCCSVECRRIYRSKNPNKGIFRKGFIPWNKDIKGMNLNHQNSKSVEQMDKFSGDVINVFPSAAEAERVTGINQDSITNNTNGRSKSAGGYKWRKVL